MQLGTRNGSFEEAVAAPTGLGEDAENSASSGAALDAGLRSDLDARAQRQRGWERLARWVYSPLGMLCELVSGLAILAGILFICGCAASFLGFITSTDALIRLWMDGILAVVAMFALVLIAGCLELLLLAVEVLFSKLAKRQGCEPPVSRPANRVVEWVMSIGQLTNPR